MKTIKSLILIVSVVFISSKMKGQGENLSQINQKSLKMCETLKELSKENDSIAISTFYFQELMPLEGEIDKENPYMDTLLFRLSINCNEFRRLFSERTEITEKFKPTIQPDQILEFKEIDEFTLEQGGEKNLISLTKKSWKETHLDGTTSLYDLNWITENQFEIIFKQSSNDEISQFLIQGDTIKFNLINKSNGAFILFTSLDDESVMDEIKLIPNHHKK